MSCSIFAEFLKEIGPVVLRKTKKGEIMRQTNHNGRVNSNTGAVYSRKHNDRQYDITTAENIVASKVIDNIIIHYDVNNNAYRIDNLNAKRKSIDEHEHEMYQELFGSALKSQNQRNIDARHPERNKTIDDLLDAKNTCPEETIFQIGSLDDGFPPPDVLWRIFESYQKDIIEHYGDNIHFLDAVMHLDESVPHIHVRKVWTYHGKDGLAISQNKALEEMGFERPEPDKKPSKWNNAKVTFTEYERNLKLAYCEAADLEIETKPKYPGKASMTKEKYIADKLLEENMMIRQKNQAIQAELENTNQMILERNHQLQNYEKNLSKQELWIVQKESQLKAIETDLRDEKAYVRKSYSQMLAATVKEKITELFDKLLTPIVKRFEGKHQRTVLDVMDQMTIDSVTAEKFAQIGYPNMQGHTISDVLDKAEEDDILDALEQAGVNRVVVDDDTIQIFIDKLREGMGKDEVAQIVAKSISTELIRKKHR